MSNKATEGISLETVAAILNISVPVAAQRAREGSLPYIRYNGSHFVAPETALRLYASGDWNIDEQTKLANAAIYGAETMAHDVAAAADAKRAAEKVERDKAGHEAWVARAEREAAAKVRNDAALETGSNVRRA